MNCSLLARAYNLKPNEDVELAKNEASTLRKLNRMFLNTYIIKYLDLYHDRETKHLYFIMEYYEVYIFEIKT